MNGGYRTFSIDDEGYYDDESLSAEFLPQLISGLGTGIGGVASTIGNAVQGFLGGGAPQRPPLPPVQVSPTGPGVGSAEIRTPAGNATIALPQPVVRQDEFRQTTGDLQRGLNDATGRLNTVQRDLQGLTQRVGSIVADTTRDVAKVATELAQSRREHNTAIDRIRRDIRSQSSTSMLMSIMLQRQLQDDLDEHTHPIATHDHSFDTTAETVGENELPVATSSRSGAADSGNMGLLFLPMMMGQGDGRDGGDEGGGMMAMAMMMALSK